MGFRSDLDERTSRLFEAQKVLLMELKDLHAGVSDLKSKVSEVDSRLREVDARTEKAFSYHNSGQFSMMSYYLKPLLLIEFIMIGFIAAFFAFDYFYVPRPAHDRPHYSDGTNTVTGLPQSYNNYARPAPRSAASYSDDDEEK